MCTLLQGSLNEFMGLGRHAWREAREVMQRLLSPSEGVLRDDAQLRTRVMVPQVAAGSALTWLNPSCCRDVIYT